MKRVLILKKTNLMNSLFKCILFSLFIIPYSCSSNDDYEIFSQINGTITDYQTGVPIENASVVLSPLGISQQTDDTGYYNFEELDAQQYTIIVQKTGYQPNRKTITAISGETMNVNIQLTLIPQ